MNTNRNSSGDQARAFVLHCCGCWAAIDKPAGVLQAGDRYAPLCNDCDDKVLASATLRDLIGACRDWDLSLPGMCEAFQRMGLPAPTTADTVHSTMVAALRRAEASRHRGA